jgi:protein subunit release factor B
VPPRHPGEGRGGAGQDRALTVGKARASVQATNEKNRQRAKAKREADEHRIRLINQARIASTRELRVKDIAGKREMGIVSAQKAKDELAKTENCENNVTIMDLEIPNNNDFIRKFIFGFQGNK